MAVDDDSLGRARARVAALQAWLAAAQGAPVRLVETHISWVLLGSALAWKLKKPVRLPFLDFYTPAARRHFCEEELRLNRRLAPALYLDVVDVCEGPEGVSFGGGGAVVDAAVRMQRFPDGALWSEMLAAGRLAPRHVDAMALRLSRFHAEAAVAPPGKAYGSAASHEHVVRGLVEGINGWVARAPPALAAGWPGLCAWLALQVPLLAPLWEARRREGRVRECHGDLHLANVLQLGDEATAFDGIEFDDDLRFIDVLDDIAFLVMDLLAQQQAALAWRLLNAYLEASGDYAGLPALRYYLVCRAMVRAQVAALGAQQGLQGGKGGKGEPGTRAAAYLGLAVALSRGADPRLAITHGLPGSGKSFVSQAMLEAAGALRVRSDVERKRLFGLQPLDSSHERVPGGIYDAATTVRTYARLREVARTALQAGWPVLVDAAFLHRAERAQFAALAGSLGVPYAIVDCQAPLAVLRQRLAERQARGGDASEADEAVLDRLREADQPLDAQERAVALPADAAQGIDPVALAQRWLHAGRH